MGLVLDSSATVAMADSLEQYPSTSSGHVILRAVSRADYESGVENPKT